MGRQVKRHAKLLERCFSRQEWEYLKRHEDFKNRLEVASDSLADFEQLCAFGDNLLSESEAGNPERDKFHRVGTRKPQKQTAF